MDVKKIKQEANQIYLQHRQQMIPEFFFIGYVSLLAQYLQSGIFSFFVSLFLCPVSHGYVKCSMRLVDEENVSLDYQDSMIGIIDFVRVAPTYLVRKAVILLPSFLVSIPILFYTRQNIPAFSLESISFLGNSFIQTEFLIPDFQILMSYIGHIFIFIGIIMCILVYFVLVSLFTPVPYLLEEENFSWIESMMSSYHLMKGHLWAFFCLYMHYFKRHVMYCVVVGMIVMLVGKINAILMLFCLVISLIFYIDIFKGRFEIAKYLFYKEIREDSHERFNED